MTADPRTQPTAVKIHLTSGAGVDITWADGHQSHYDFDYLRERCPCATCRDQREKAAGKILLPLYKEKPRALQAEPVGHYAVRFTFSDGHATGIYSFEHFRDICPCPACRPTKADEPV
jgi:DUF971 family protein